MSSTISTGGEDVSVGSLVHALLAGNRLFLAGCLLGVFILFSSVGTNDVKSWALFADSAQSVGLEQTYHDFPRRMNHPPPITLVMGFVYKASEVSGLSFSFCMRTVMLAAHLAIAALLAVFWIERDGPDRARQVLGLYSLSLAPLLIAAYHGNTDTLCALLCLLAVLLQADGRRPFTAGAVLGLALGIKLIALLFLSLILFAPRDRKDRWLSLAGLAVTAGIPFGLGAVFFGEPFLRNLFLYKPVIEAWGIQGPLSVMDFFAGGDTFRQLYARLGSILILAFSQVWGYLSTRQHKAESVIRGATINALFFIVAASGFGIQYLVYPSAFLFLLKPRWAFILSTAAGIFLLAVYGSFMTALFPFESYHTRAYGVIPFALSIPLWTGYLVSIVSLLCSQRPRRDVIPA